MRYYRIFVDGKQMWCSLGPDGNTDPGALNVELDITQAPTDVPEGAAWLRVWGIPLAMIGQSSNFNGKTIQVYGGMSKGLPLANPAQQGLLTQGLIQQCWGNWISVNQTLDFLVTAGANAPGTAATATTPGQSKTAGNTASVTPQTPLNLSFNWQANTPLATAIKNTLATALPGFKVNTNISERLVRTHTVPGYFGNLQQFSEYLRRVSGDIISANPYGGTGYKGVQVVLDGSTINVLDDTQSTGGAKQIAFTDLIGQPTWKSAFQIQTTLVMRGDLKVGQAITLPPSQITISGNQGFEPGVPRNTSIFQGEFTIQKIRHVGNYKQPSGAAWTTIVDCYTKPSANPPSSQSTENTPGV